MLLNVNDFTNDNAVKTFTLERNLIDFETEHRQLVSKVAGFEVWIDPLAQPGIYYLHSRYLNWRRNRMSFSKNVRRSSTRYRSIARRSIPMPNA